MQCHGFGGSRAGAGHPELARALVEAGDVVLRFDFRGCGESDGEPGRVLPEEEIQIHDLRAAVDFLQAQPGVDARRLAGSSGSSSPSSSGTGPRRAPRD